MRKLNNKGFLMVETVIVSVFVLAIFLLVYRNSIPMVGMYKNRERYDDIDSVYNANLFRNLVIRDGYIYDSIIARVDNEGYVDITNCEVFRESTEIYDTCINLKRLVGLEDFDGVNKDDKIFVTNWDLSIRGTNGNLLSNSTLNRGMLEYVKYLNEQGEREKSYSYRLILSRTVFHRYEEAIGEYEENEVSIKESEKSTTHYANIGL